MNTYSPSHANSSVNQVANAYRGNPQALEQRTRTANGMTPELIDLLAFQKLQADKKQAASQMALASGEQPTVAQGMKEEAMNSARDEVTKSMGLPGLMQRSQNAPPPQQPQQPQGAPQSAPQPQGAPQMMAAGGLASARSNLPKQYQNGGIVAFDEGGDVDEEPKKSAEEAQRESDQAALSKLWSMAKSGNEKAAAAIMDIASMPVRGIAGAYDTAVVRPMRALGADAAYLSEYVTPEGADPSSATPFYDRIRAKESVGKGTDEQLAAANADRARRPGQGRTAAYPDVAAEQAPAKRAPVAAPRPEARAQGLGSIAPAKPSAAPAMSEEDANDLALKRKLHEGILRGLNVDKEAAGAAGRKRYEEQLGAGNLALAEAQIQRAEGLRALQAKNAGERPSDFWTAINRMGQNTNTRGLGGAFSGVTDAVEGAKAGYRKQDIKDMSDVNALLDLADKAKRENNIAAFNAYTAAAQDAASEYKAAQTAGGAQVTNTEARKSREEIKRQGALDRKSREGMGLADRMALKQTELDARQSNNALNQATAAVADEMKIPGRASQLKKQGITVADLTRTYYREFLSMQQNKGAPASGAFTLPTGVKVTKLPG